MIATLKLLICFCLVALFVYLSIKFYRFFFLNHAFLSGFPLMCFNHGNFQTLITKNKLMNFHIIS